MRFLTEPVFLQVLVGHNNKQNDVLTHSIARPTDIWMHARGVAGAHVLLRISNDRKEKVPDEDLQCAADLAAWFSKVRPVTNLRFSIQSQLCVEAANCCVDTQILLVSRLEQK